MSSSATSSPGAQVDDEIQQMDGVWSKTFARNTKFPAGVCVRISFTLIGVESSIDDGGASPEETVAKE